MIELLICALIFTAFGAYLGYQHIKQQLQAQIADLIEEGYLKTHQVGEEVFLVKWPEDDLG